MKVVSYLAIILVLIGGINWGLIGIFDWNAVKWIFRWGILDRIVYVLVGISSVYLLLAWKAVFKPQGR